MIVLVFWFRGSDKASEPCLSLCKQKIRFSVHFMISALITRS